jgi:hypothetical protein
VPGRRAVKILLVAAVMVISMYTVSQMLSNLDKLPPA